MKNIMIEVNEYGVGMTQEVVDYMKSELNALKINLDKIRENYNNASHMERVEIAVPLNRAESIYYHFWMVCNDLGIAAVGQAL